MSTASLLAFKNFLVSLFIVSANLLYFLCVSIAVRFPSLHTHDSSINKFFFGFVTASPSPGPTSETTSETEEGLSGGAIAGIVIGVTVVSVVIVVVLIVGFIVYLKKQIRNVSLMADKRYLPS